MFTWEKPGWSKSQRGDFESGFKYSHALREVYGEGYTLGL